jgi:hypothetical protein
VDLADAIHSTDIFFQMEAALKLTREEDRHVQANVPKARGDTESVQQRFGEATPWYTKALDHYTMADSRLGTSNVLVEIAKVRALTGEITLAATLAFLPVRNPT